MIYQTNAYGIALTDEFGGFYDDYTVFQKLDFNDENIQQHFHDCPSAEDNQYVLGIHVEITKNMDIKAIHNSWLEYIESLPENIKSIFNSLDKNLIEPDFQILAGHY